MENKELEVEETKEEKEVVADHYEIKNDPWVKSNAGEETLTSVCHLYYGQKEIEDANWEIGVDVPIEITASFMGKGILAVKPNSKIKKTKTFSFTIQAKSQEITLASLTVQVEFVHKAKVNKKGLIIGLSVGLGVPVLAGAITGIVLGAKGCSNQNTESDNALVTSDNQTIKLANNYTTDQIAGLCTPDYPHKIKIWKQGESEPTILENDDLKSIKLVSVAEPTGDIPEGFLYYTRQIESVDISGLVKYSNAGRKIKSASFYQCLILKEIVFGDVPVSIFDDDPNNDNFTSDKTWTDLDPKFMPKGLTIKGKYAKDIINKFEYIREEISSSSDGKFRHLVTENNSVVIDVSSTATPVMKTIEIVDDQDLNKLIPNSNNEIVLTYADTDNATPTDHTISVEKLYALGLKKENSGTSINATDKGFLEGCYNLCSLDLDGLKHVTNFGNNFLKKCTKLSDLDLSQLTALQSETYTESHHAFGKESFSDINRCMFIDIGQLTANAFTPDNTGNNEYSFTYNQTEGTQGHGKFETRKLLLLGKNDISSNFELINDGTYFRNIEYVSYDNPYYADFYIDLPAELETETPVPYGDVVVLSGSNDYWLGFDLFNMFTRKSVAAKAKWDYSIEGFAGGKINGLSFYNNSYQLYSSGASTNGAKNITFTAEYNGTIIKTITTKINISIPG